MKEFPHVEPLFNLSVKNDGEEEQENSLNNMTGTSGTSYKEMKEEEEEETIHGRRKGSEKCKNSGHSSSYHNNNNDTMSTNRISFAQSSKGGSQCPDTSSIGSVSCRENVSTVKEENVRIFKDFRNENEVKEVGTCDTHPSLLSKPESLPFKLDPLHVFIDRDRDLFSIPFSSGTTGDPKAVAKLHRAMLCLYHMASPEFGFATKTRDFHPIISCHPPFSHVGGMAMLIEALLTGSTAAIINGFNVNNYLELVHKFKINCTFLVPSYITQLVRFVTNPPPSATTLHPKISLVDVLVAGESLPEGIAREFITKFNVKKFRQSYGSTEVGWATMTPEISSSPSSDGFTIKSSGIPLHGTTIRIVDVDTGLPVEKFNQVGEIYIGGPQVTPYYLRNEEANKSSFDGRFFRSGDGGFIDPRGHLVVADRFKEVIKFDGVQVSPSELESILREHPIVKEVAVIGIPDEVHGQVPKGFVVLNFSPLSNSSSLPFSIETDTRTTMTTQNKKQKEQTDETGNKEETGVEENMKLDDDESCDRSFVQGRRTKNIGSLSIPWNKGNLSDYFSLTVKELENELIEFVAMQVAPFKQMRGGIEFLESFPRTIIGKIDRKVLRSKT